MTKWVRLPVEIDAIRFCGVDPADGQPTFDFFNDVPPRWLKVALDRDRIHVGGNGKLYVRTLEGYLVASQYDYICRGIKGELYPCKPDIFEKLHRRAD